MVSLTPTAAPPVAAASSHRSLLLATGLAPAMWGTTYWVMTEMLPHGAPWFAAAVRSLPAGMLAILIAKITTGGSVLPAPKWRAKVLALGLINVGAFFPLLLISADRLPGGVAASMGGAQPLVSAAIGYVALGERASWQRLGWGALGAVGVVLVVLRPDAQFDTLGLLAGLGAVLTMGCGIVSSRAWGRPQEASPILYAGWQLSIGGMVLVPLALLVDGVPGPIDGRAALGYLYLMIIGGLVSYTLWFRGLARLDVGATAVLALLSPIVAAAIGWLALDQGLTAMQVVGFVAMIVALLASQRAVAREAATRSERLG